MKKADSGVYEKYIKRALDIVLALSAMLLLCWLYAIIAILVRLRLGRPVIFRQQRPGRHGRPFYICKFRMMTDEHDENGRFLPDSERLTDFGRRLRTSSLDELPELWNILKGDMSFIGPRPLLTEYLPYYTEDEQHRHGVRPGLSGWAQVNGRNLVDWDKRLSMDVFYAENISFAFDFRIFLMTVRTVLSRSGVSEDTQDTEGNLAAIRKI